MNSGNQWAVLLGLMSAAAFATSNALQHRVAGAVPVEVDRAFGVIAVVVRKPLWLMASTISFGAVILHGTALRHGSVSLVQPLMLVGVVVAVPLRSALDLKVPSRDEVRAVLITMAGLGALLACATPQPSAAPPSGRTAAALVIVGLVLAGTVLKLLASLEARPRLAAATLGCTSGVMFGLTAGLLKMLGAAMGDRDLMAAVGPLVGLVAAGLLGVAMNQRAYQLASLSLSMPLINVIDVVVAVLFGALVFHELPGHTPGLLALQGLALVWLCFGLREIARIEESAVGWAA
jgi:hypothetical protein